MKLDKKIATAFAITSLAIAGTALASYTTTTTTKSVSIGNSSVITAEQTTTITTTTPMRPVSESVTVIAASPEAILANIIFKVLGIPVTVHEITTLKSYNMGNGEVTLAYNLAHASGKSIDQILNMRYEQKMGWGKIAKTLGVKLHGAVDKSVYILKESHMDLDADQLVISINTTTNDAEENDDKHNHKDDKEKHNDNGNDGKKNNSHKPSKGPDKHN